LDKAIIIIKKIDKKFQNNFDGGIGLNLTIFTLLILILDLATTFFKIGNYFLIEKNQMINFKIDYISNIIYHIDFGFSYNFFLKLVIIYFLIEKIK